jgi:hypothetical protein
MRHEDTRSENLPTVVTGDGFNDIDTGDRLIRGTIIRCVDGH